MNSVALGADTVTTAPNQVNVGGRTVSGVANGVAASDAVNVSQLSATNAMIMSESADRANADAALTARLDNMSFDIRDTAREGRAGTAAALAAAGLPQASGAGRTMIAGGVGTYRGRTAFAIGASHRLQGGNATFKVGMTYDSEKKVGANGGVGFEF
jgi:autotransporter adhesin